MKKKQEFSYTKRKQTTECKSLSYVVLTLLLTTAVLAAIPSAFSATKYTFDTYSFISASPNPVGVGQTLQINAWLDKLPPLGVSGSWDSSFKGFTIAVTKPDGTNMNLGPFNSDPVGSIWTTYVPTTVGTYFLQMTFPGQTVPAYNVTYNPSTSMKISIMVQQNQIQGYPAAQLPTGYWQRPVYGLNREWSQISGNWLGGGPTNYGFTITNYNALATGTNGGSYAPYTASPESAHIVWTKPVAFGGVIGGEFGSSGTSEYYTGREYEPKFLPPVIIQGRLFYNVMLGSSSIAGVSCVDLRTGKEIWFQNGSQISIGQVLDYISPNQYGGIPYLWDTSTTIWKMYDAFTGLKILSIANATSGTAVTGPNGELLVYKMDGTRNWLALWNSTLCIGNLALTGTGGWQWRPPLGATLNWLNGIQWNVTIQAYAAQTINFIDLKTGILLATSASPDNFARAETWQMEIGYNTNNGQQLWVQNRTFAGGITSWGLMGYMSEGVYTEYIASSMQWYGYDELTGNKLWGPTQAYANAWDMYQSGVVIGDGKLYDKVIGGITAYDVKTGTALWNFTPPSSGLETVYGFYPLQEGGMTLAGDKIFTSTTHSHTQPLFRGAQLLSIDANTGKELWSISFWNSGWKNVPVVADGYLVALNCYDNQLYAFGQGQTATTVSAPETAIPQGTQVMIKGTITDQSPGQTCLGIPAAGTPAIADSSMTAWMEYLYMQQPKPNNATGVPVHVTATDPNGNFQDIGTAVSDDLGNYAISWAPPVPGMYTVRATFTGSNSYYSSQAGTSFIVSKTSAASPTVSTPIPTQAPTTVIVPTQAPTAIVTVAPTPSPVVIPPTSAAPTATYIAIGAVVIVIVAVAAALVLRRRK